MQPLASSEDPLRKSLFPAVPETDRPWTAPVSLDSMSQMLPPKRELPFARPQERKSAGKLAINQEDGSKNTRVQGDEFGSAISKEKAPIAILPSNIAREKLKDVRAKTTRGGSKPAGTTKTREAATEDTSLSEGPVQRNATSSHTIETTVPASQQAEQSKKVIKPSATKKQYTSTATQTLPMIDEPPTRSTNSDASNIPEEWIEAMINLIVRAKDSPLNQSGPPVAPANTAAKEVSDLLEYAKRPTAERTAALEVLIGEFLQDDNFVTLCEDVERVWQRMALGM